MAIPILSVILTVALLATATACAVYDGVWLPFAAGLAVAFVASGGLVAGLAWLDWHLSARRRQPTNPPRPGNTASDSQVGVRLPE
jgi:hypothetical protein